MRTRPSPTALILAAAIGLALLAAAGVAAWHLFAGGGAAAPQSAAPGAPEAGGRAPAALDPAPASTPPSDAARTDALAAGLAQPPPDDGAGADRTRPRSAAERELEGALWIDGLVLFPPGTPPEERALVSAHGAPFEHRPLHEAEVDAEGRFRVAFGPGTKTGWLDLEALHLSLEKRVQVVRSRLDGPVVLEPELAGAVVCVLRPREGSEELARSLVGREVELVPWEEKVSGAHTVQAPSEPRRLLAPEGLELAIGGLRAGSKQAIECRTGLFAPARTDLLEIAGGRTLRAELELVPAARIAGRVVDDSQSPVPSASLVLEGRTVEHGRVLQDERGATDGEGRFSFEGVSPGRFELLVEAAGFLPETVDLGPVGEGEERPDLEVTLDRGSAIRGVVRWPGGEPAADATVEVREPQPGRSFSRFDAKRESEARTDEHGAFLVAGLGTGPCEVTATARREEEKGPKARRTWRAVAEAVLPDGEAIVLELARPLVLSGTVVDDARRPLENFEVRGMREGTSSVSAITLGRRRRDQPAATGRFELEGLYPGTWEITVKAKGHVDATLVVDLPGQEEGLEIALLRCASVAGVVLGSSGAPVAGAEIVGRVPVSVSGVRYLADRDFGTADAGGRFHLEDLDPGEVGIRATAEGKTPSEEVSLDLAPGETAGGLVLRLGDGARVTGEIRGPDRGGRQVSLHSRSERHSDRTESDSRGRFAFDAVPPGRYEVSAAPRAREGTDELQAEGELDWLEFWRLSLSAAVTVVEGEDTHVVLGEQPAGAVVLFGVVRRGGSPVAGAVVQAESIEGWSRWLDTRTDGEGRYELALDGPGDWWLGVTTPEGSALTGRGERVPAEPRHRADLELPAGGVAGRVLDSEGAPLEASVSLQKARGGAGDPDGFVEAWDETGQDGRYRIDGLPAGSYLLFAEPIGGAHLGAVQRRFSLGEGEELHLDLVLEPATSIEGRVVRSSGEPARDARVMLHDELGNALDFVFPTSTDAAGRYRLEGLPAGRWRVSASTRSEASPASAPVAVSAGSSKRVDLALSPATRLRVIVEKADGTPIPARLAVLDERGADWAAARDYSDPGGPAPENGAAFGPLPPGRWRVVATFPDLRAEQSLELAGEPERTLRLRLGD